MSPFELPTKSGAYRWYYVDVSSADTTVVCIFMIGSVFSGRYARGLPRGALPTSHAAVNFAVYQHGRRTTWALTEYAKVEVEGAALRIGSSELAWREGRLEATIDERTTPFMFTGWGRQLRARLSLTPTGPSHPSVNLVPGLSHHWRPFAARAEATFSLDDGPTQTGLGYHDGNWGDVPLGTDLRGWEWKRVHRARATEIHYQPWAEVPASRVVVDAAVAESTAVSALMTQRQRTAWGLDVPRELEAGRAPAMLESSPFYARLESRSPEQHSLGEVADFARFHRPTVRWMAGFKTRVGRST